MKNLKNTPEGTRDILFDECERMRLVEAKLSRLFSLRGYHEVITPGIEYYDVFSTDGGYISPQSMFKLTDHTGKLIVLRPDCTIPIARMTATRLRSYPLPIRLFYNQHLFRAERMLRGKSCERVQAGVELIGASGRRADLEVLSLAIHTFQLFPSADYRIELGHIGILHALAAQLNAPEEEIELLRSLIEQKNYTALDERLAQYSDSPAAESLRILPRLFGNGEVFEKASSLLSPITQSPLAELKAIYDDLSAIGIGDRILIDCGMVQSQHYYTGVIFQGYVNGAGDAVLSGGRYDGLIADYGTPQPATGFAVEVDTLASLLPPDTNRKNQTEILIYAREGYQAKALNHLASLENKGVEYSVFETAEESKAYARERKIPELHLVGPSIEILREGEY